MILQNSHASKLIPRLDLDTTNG